MAENQHVPALDQHTEILWYHYNYPPLLKLMHFVPRQIPKQKKFIVMALFSIHIAIFANTILNFIDSCTQGGLRVLYSFLLILFLNPFVLFIFYRGFTGICKDSSNLKLYFITQPIAIVLEILMSIINFFGFNSFLRAANLFEQQKNFSAVLAILVSVIFLSVALFSGFIFFRMVRERKQLTASMI